MVHNQNNIEMNITLTLLRGKIHLRELARTISEPHATVLRRLNHLRELGILDYKKEGKNNIYSLKDNLLARQWIYQAENHKLVKLIKNYPELSIILEEIIKNCKEELIVLFGSYAKFSADKNSDIDIYIETNNHEIKSKLKNINSKINVKTGLFDLNSLLIKEIIKNHVIIKGTEKFYEKIKVFS